MPELNPKPVPRIEALPHFVEPLSTDPDLTYRPLDPTKLPEPYPFPKPPDNPWKCLRREAVYENPWIKVEHHAIKDAADRDGVYGVVGFRNAALGIVVLDGRDTILVGQWRYPFNRYSWEIPAGGGMLPESTHADARDHAGNSKSDPGKSDPGNSGTSNGASTKQIPTLLESAQRELQEETGILASHWTVLQDLQLSNSATDEIGTVFLATQCRFGAPKPTPDERIQSWRLPVADAIALVHKRVLVDSLTVVGLLALESRLLRGKVVLPPEA